MIRMALGQYDQIADAAYNGEVSTHPLMPLRIKIINAVVATKLIKRYGKNVTKQLKIKYIAEYNKCIDDIVCKIYPEVISEPKYDNELLFNMSVAVALSDGEITEKEVFLIDEFSIPRGRYDDILKEVITNPDSNYFQVVLDKLIKIAIARAKELELQKHDLVPLTRRLLLVAAADGNVDQNELETILRFAENFGFSRLDIITTFSTLGL